MRSVKSKLFLGYALTIFIVLFTISSISLSLFKDNQEEKNMEILESTYIQIEELLKNNQINKINEIDDFEDSEDMFIFIYKNETLFYSNKSSNNTKKIFSKIMKKKNKEYRKEKHEREEYEREEHDNYFEINEYIFYSNDLEDYGNSYKIYIGVDEHVLDGFLEDIYIFVFVFNLVLYLVLLLLGYLLISKTIKPLKNILDDVNRLQEQKDLSKRLKVQKTKDEFEELSNSFNSMLEWIENSVENIKQFSSDASHELRTPLTVIQGEIELCKTGDKNIEELNAVLKKIDFEQKNLQNIIEDFLLLSKLDKEVMNQTLVSLDKVTFEAIERNLKKIDEKKLKLVLDIDEDLKINFSEKYLFVVINNLLSNAIKYTNEGYIKIEAKKINNEIFFKIEDSGLGIKEEELEAIFQRFYRADKVRTSPIQGLGLGLSIVEKICDRFNYAIKVRSTVDKGSTFKIEKKS